MALLEPPRDELTSLFELVDPTDENEGLESYLRRALQVSAEWFHASGATLFLDNEEGEYILVARAGIDTTAPLGAVIQAGEGIAGTALETGEPMLVRDPLEHALLENRVAKRREDIGSSLIVPLQTPQFGKLGVLCLSRRRGEDDFSQRDLNAARSVAGQVALAVANARLYAKAKAALAIERELAEAKRLAEIGQMTAAIAHEIRNPLTGMRGAAQVIQALGGEAAEFGQIIEQETSKLDRLCSDFLEFARPFQPQIQATDLSDLAESVVANHRPEFLAKGVALIFDKPAGLPTIHVDPLRIEQVLHNLLRNALQASESGASVRLRVEPHGFTVEDEGKGMATEEVERLFTPFFTTKPSGTGLGMSVVKKIVDAHRGRVEAESALGKGTRILVWLPTGTNA